MSAFARAELFSRRRMIAGLAAGACTLLAIVAASYQSLGQVAFGRTLARGHAPRVYTAFAGSRDIDLASPHGWMSFGFNHPLFLVLTLTVAISIGTALVAGEVESGRAELLFVRPRSRRQFLVAGVAVWVCAEFLVLIAALAGALIAGAFSAQMRAAGLAPLILAPLQFLPLAAFVAGLSFLASARARTRGQAMGLAVGVTVLAYLANFVSTLVGGLGWLRWISPFGYYDPAGAIVHGFAFWHAAILLAGAGLLLAAAGASFDRRDLA